tara:strand:- start:510 stop:710 length:201 start_codon:yes stop_codon:yes gene_type:complete
MGWLLKLFGSIGDLRALIAQLFKIQKDVTANQRQTTKDKVVDDAINAAISRGKLHDRRAEQQRETD